MAKILIVDDEPDILSALSRYFERSGHDVLRAQTGEGKQLKHLHNISF